MTAKHFSARPGYNTRLFSGGFRTRLHTARFHWLQKTLQKRSFTPDSVLELGSYDGRAVEYLPQMPVRYLGLDAGWENALNLARQRWSQHPHLEFRQCTKPAEMQINHETFELAIALETLEHIPADLLEPYLKNIQAALKPGALFLASVPNENGIVFAAKHVLKMFLLDSPDQYSFNEFINQMTGNTDKVARHDHKGFSYAKMIKTLNRYFTIEKVQGIPFAFLPPCLNFGVGIVCRKI